MALFGALLMEALIAIPASSLALAQTAPGDERKGDGRFEMALRARRPMEQSDMEEKDNQKQPKRPGRDASEIRVVRVASNPGPDAQDRLRRLLTLMVKYATQDRLDAPEKDSAEGGGSEGEE